MLPELEYVRLKVVAEYRAKEGFECVLGIVKQMKEHFFTTFVLEVVTINCSCYIPEKGNIININPIVVDEPQMLCVGIVSTGPLTRSLFFFGWTEEQALVFNIKNKGLVTFTG